MGDSAALFEQRHSLLAPGYQNIGIQFFQQLTADVDQVLLGALLHIGET